MEPRHTAAILLLDPREQQGSEHAHPHRLGHQLWFSLHGHCERPRKTAPDVSNRGRENFFVHSKNDPVRMLVNNMSPACRKKKSRVMMIIVMEEMKFH